ncbi:hypothetical protein ACFX14_041741 [Malus domestica]|uniref:Uncharacterized protein n=1 Tax=Malus domestica TaxID=3750 RepID=A0A498JH00_MALDO|nr:hypothetical protein DVH24_024504 [Malus domestica]
MSKENVQAYGGGLTAEQRNRISRNFRAAKALIDRKRPCNDAVSPDHHLPHTKVQRTPLPISASRYNSARGEYGSASCSGSLSVSRTESSVSKSDSFTTPIRQPQFLTSFDSFSASGILNDDDFDESILQEIDALIEQKPSVDIQRDDIGSCGSDVMIRSNSQFP